jgi:hypothetical protein
VLPSPQEPSNFGRSTVADEHRRPPPSAHRGQLTPSLSAPPRPLSQHYINTLKLYDLFVDSLVHCIAFTTLAGVYLRRRHHYPRRSPLIRSVCSQLTTPTPFPRLTSACVQVLRRCWPPEHRRRHCPLLHHFGLPSKSPFPVTPILDTWCNRTAVSS